MQKQVNNHFAKGFPGMKASGSCSFYYAQGLIAEGNIKAGTFVWLGTNPDQQAKNTGAANVKPVGLVERVLVSCDCEDFYPNACPLAVAVNGEYWVTCLNEAKAGDKAFARLSDGCISSLASASKLSGHVETSWKIVTSAPAGEPVIISNTSGE